MILELADDVRVAREGDADAFDRLVSQQADGAYRLAVAIVGPADAADVVQEAFLDAWRGLRSLREADRFEPWLRRIVINRCRMALRSTRRHQARVRAEADMHRQEGGLSDDFRLGSETRASLEQAFEALSADQRIVLALHYVTDLTIAAVAVELRLPIGTAKSRLAAALAAMRRALEEQSS
ncbi:MAG: sigma-70 family RNA polymerase sigma factor [Chloroflexi bacterium]|nr:sigma-70 family RNA polymerase sigma factor [Chloroflexota bacterium]